MSFCVLVLLRVTTFSSWGPTQCSHVLFVGRIRSNAGIFPVWVFHLFWLWCVFHLFDNLRFLFEHFIFYKHLSHVLNFHFINCVDHFGLLCLRQLCLTSVAQNCRAEWRPALVCCSCGATFMPSWVWEALFSNWFSQLFDFCFVSSWVPGWAIFSSSTPRAILICSPSSNF